MWKRKTAKAKNNLYWLLNTETNEVVAYTSFDGYVLYTDKELNTLLDKKCTDAIMDTLIPDGEYEWIIASSNKRIGSYI